MALSTNQKAMKLNILRFGSEIQKVQLVTEKSPYKVRLLESLEAETGRARKLLGCPERSLQSKSGIMSWFVSPVCPGKLCL